MARTIVVNIIVHGQIAPVILNTTNISTKMDANYGVHSIVTIHIFFKQKTRYVMKSKKWSHARHSTLCRSLIYVVIIS